MSISKHSIIIASISQFRNENYVRIMFQTNLFAGQVALVTGGGSGIGYEIARQLLTYGAEVWIASRKQERLDTALAELSSLGRCHTAVLDIRLPEAAEALAERIASESGRLDILVNNAGGQFPLPAESITTKGWNAVINTNLNGTWYVTQAMANKFFLAQESGSIVNIVLNNFRGTPGMAHSAAARAGVMNLTKTLAIEWIGRHVRINSVAPGVIFSSGLDNYPPELVEMISAKLPMKRFGTVEEVANAVTFLSSPMASYITGETLYVDGGSRLWGDIWEI